MPTKFWAIVARCETGHTPERPRLDHDTKTYVSALGINKTTWRNWSALPPKAAARMTFAEQIEIAERIAFRGFQNPKQNRYVWPVGVGGWACYKTSPEARAILCKSRHRLVTRWKHQC